MFPGAAQGFSEQDEWLSRPRFAGLKKAIVLACIDFALFDERHGIGKGLFKRAGFAQLLVKHCAAKVGEL